MARLLEEVDAAAAGLLEVLLAKLRGSVQLPECLRIIGFLRRLAAFSEQVRWNPGSGAEPQHIAIFTAKKIQNQIPLKATVFLRLTPGLCWR